MIWQKHCYHRNNVKENIVDSNAYKASTWGQTVEGEYVIDGYKYKGRQPFKRTKDKLEMILHRGTQSEINGFIYKVLDRRIKGIDLEIEIEISESSIKGVDSRGVVVAKLYGPNKKKENTVAVTKCKD